MPPNFMRAGPNDGAAYILRLLAIMVGLWLWLLCLWFFVVSVGSLWKYVKPDRSLPYQITWFSFVFPNTALVSRSHTRIDSA